YRAGDPEARRRWQAHAAADREPGQARLGEAQRVIAREHGFDTWNALRAHVEQLTGAAPAAPVRARLGLVYDDPPCPPGGIVLSGPLTSDVGRRLTEEGVIAAKLDDSVPPATWHHLAAVPSLHRLDLSGHGEAGDDHLAFLAAMPRLTEISLSGCRLITDAGVLPWCGHAGLACVNLQWTASGDAVAAALAGKPSLYRVALGCGLTDRGAAHLRDCTALREPGHPDTFVAVSSSVTLTDEALAHLGDLAGVESLDLSYSVFGSPHFTARGIAHLRRITALEELNLDGTWATDAVLHALAGIARLRRLHCQDMVSGDDGFFALSRCSTLEWIGGRFCQRITDRGYAALARLPRLRSLDLGGRRVSDQAMAAMVDAPALAELTPHLFGDAAFEHIARLPWLTKLGNMYNRDTTDAATRCLRGHPRLTWYGAYGTQITDESLRILAELPAIETVEFTNCDHLTDAGLRELARAPRLKRVAVGSCPRVRGEWVHALGRVTTEFDPSNRGDMEQYRYWTLLDYPDLPVWDVEDPPADGAPAELLRQIVVLGCHAECRDGGLRLEADGHGREVRRVGLLTREACAAPARIELVVQPLGELRLHLARLAVAMNDDGTPQSTTGERGTSHAGGWRPPGDWARVTLELDDRERRLYVDGVLRHTWPGDFEGYRTRVGVGPRRSAITVRELTVAPQ
ncbi:MAG: hypothetical protein HYU66_04630, partial [Armatimonadetes bacterium]|nr:hypothetical protein [Armatimonadota bacterium]